STSHAYYSRYSRCLCPSITVFAVILVPIYLLFFFFSSRRRHTRSVSAFPLNRSSDLQEQESEGILQSPAYHQRKPQRSDEHESGQRSEERRVGKECRSRWAAYD